jgi:hypothetical protein
MAFVQTAGEVEVLKEYVQDKHKDNLEKFFI